VATTQSTGFFAVKKMVGQSQILTSAVLPDDVPNWQASVAILNDWLSKDRSRRQLRIHLSAKFVRWLLIPWPLQLASNREVHAYAQSQFRSAYGEDALTWRLGMPELVAGEPFLVCAVDAALMSALEQCNKIDGVKIQHVGPYFSAAFDFWRTRMVPKTMWFAVIEPDVVTLALRHEGVWRGISTQRRSSPESNWLDLVRANQAQIRLSWENNDAAELPIFVLRPENDTDQCPLPQCQLLKPGGQLCNVNDQERLALGV
jgi:hypothetical protein